MTKLKTALAAAMLVGGLAAPSMAIAETAPVGAVPSAVSTCEVVGTGQTSDGRDVVLIACVDNGDGTI